MLAEKMWCNSSKKKHSVLLSSRTNNNIKLNKSVTIGVALILRDIPYNQQQIDHAKNKKKHQIKQLGHHEAQEQTTKKIKLPENRLILFSRGGLVLLQALGWPSESLATASRNARGNGRLFPLLALYSTTSRRSFIIKRYPAARWILHDLSSSAI